MKMMCKICLGEHEEAIHAATLRVREWFRGEVLKGFEVDEEPPFAEEDEEIEAAAVA